MAYCPKSLLVSSISISSNWENGKESSYHFPLRWLNRWITKNKFEDPINKSKENILMLLTIWHILNHAFLLFNNKNDIKHVCNIYLTFSTM